MIQLRQVSKFVYDIFAGVGFDQWTRVRLNTWGVQVLKGNPLNKDDLKRTESVIQRFPRGNLDPVEV